MTDKTREVLDGINTRLAAATPGPWAVMDVWDPGEGVDFIDVYAETDGLEMVCRLPNPEEFEHREPLQADAAFIAAAPADLARLTRAVEAVLELHTSDGHKNLIGPYCEHCISPIDGGPELWPCATVKAIENALNPKEGQ